MLIVAVETPKPAIIEDRDVILKVTGSTICGSDLHLYHGEHVIALLFEELVLTESISQG